MEDSVIRNNIEGIKDSYTKSTCSLLCYAQERLREQTRTKTKELEERINTLSSIIIKKVNPIDLEKAIEKII
jgi:Trm5-related predicted tRNA methylase